MTRIDGRGWDELRPVRIQRHFLKHAEGSVLISVGDTKVICSASVEDRVPVWMRGSGRGWVTAEYAMLPRATEDRSSRESSRGRVGGRTHEIQRLIGRALRSVIDLSRLGERTIWLDCDVIQADGGTRTTAVTGAFVALIDALGTLAPHMGWQTLPITQFLAATSVGIVDGTPMLDLCYKEDAAAQVDMNLVMTEQGGVIEIQGTAEEKPFSRAELDQLIDMGHRGIQRLVAMSRQTLSDLDDLLPEDYDA